jgi:hypothetical protein
MLSHRLCVTPDDEQGMLRRLILNFQKFTAIRTMEVEMQWAGQLAAIARLSASII